MVTVVQDSNEAGETEVVGSENETDSDSSGFVGEYGAFIEIGENRFRKDDVALVMLGLLLLHEVYRYVN